MRAAQEAGNIQKLERDGEMDSRNMQFGKIEGLMGLSAGDVASANELQQQGMTAMSDGITQAGTGAMAAGKAINDKINEGQ